MKYGLRPPPGCKIFARLGTAFTFGAVTMMENARDGVRVSAEALNALVQGTSVLANDEAELSSLLWKPDLLMPWEI